MYAIINVSRSLKSVFRKYYCDIDSFLHYVIHSICFAASNRNIEEINLFNVNTIVFTGSFTFKCKYINWYLTYGWSYLRRATYFREKCWIQKIIEWASRGLHGFGCHNSRCYIWSYYTYLTLLCLTLFKASKKEPCPKGKTFRRFAVAAVQLASSRCRADIHMISTWTSGNRGKRCRDRESLEQHQRRYGFSSQRCIVHPVPLF